MRRTKLFGAVVLTFAAGFAVAQENPGLSTPKEVVANGGLQHTLHAAPVVGQPFSAEQVQKRDKKLADGTNIEHFGHHFVARDSAGRVRVEQPCGCKEGEQVIAIYVLDPVAHTLTEWRTGGPSPKVAVVAKLPETLLEPKPQPVRAVGNPNRPQPIISTETLPAEIIDGLPMTVTRTTTIVPAGRSGNDAAITKTHQVWTSPDLKLTFREVWVDPRAATKTVELSKFSRAEPDPALFRAPAGFQVKDAQQTLKEAAQKLNELQSTM